MKNTLKQLGLTDKEIKVYLALLSVGETSASVLAYKTSISPSTIHYLCDRLKERGLITSSRNGNVIHYTPEGPEKILYILERQKCEIVRKEEAVHRIMGQLKALMNPRGFLPKVRFRQGSEGMFDAYQEFLGLVESGSCVYHFVNPMSKDLGGINKKAMEIFEQAKKKKKFNHCSIFVDSSLGRKIKENIKSLDGEVLLVKKNADRHKHFYTSLVSDGIVLDVNFSKQDVLSTTIHHVGFANMRQDLFELAWQEAKRQKN